MQPLDLLYVGAVLYIATTLVFVVAVLDQSDVGAPILPARWAPRLAWFAVGALANWWTWAVILRAAGLI